MSVGTRLYWLGLPDEVPGAAQYPAWVVSPDLLGTVEGGGEGGGIPAIRVLTSETVTASKISILRNAAII